MWVAEEIILGTPPNQVQDPIVKKETPNNSQSGNILSKANIFLKLEDNTADSGLSNTNVITIGSVKFTHIDNKNVFYLIIL